VWRAGIRSLSGSCFLIEGPRRPDVSPEQVALGYLRARPLSVIVRRATLAVETALARTFRRRRGARLSRRRPLLVNLSLIDLLWRGVIEKRPLRSLIVLRRVRCDLPVRTRTSLVSVNLPAQRVAPVLQASLIRMRPRELTLAVRVTILTLAPISLADSAEPPDSNACDASTNAVSAGLGDPSCRSSPA